MIIIELMNIFYIGFTVKKIHETFQNKEQMRHVNIVSITSLVIILLATLYYQLYGYVSCFDKILITRSISRKDQGKENFAAVWKEEFKVVAQLFTVTGSKKYFFQI